MFRCFTCLRYLLLFTVPLLVFLILRCEKISLSAEAKGFWKSMRHALSGLTRFFEERNLAIMASVGTGAAITAIAAIFSGMLLWAALILFIVSAVLAFELFNSAMESLLDAIAPEYHPLVKKAKDAAAAASLVMSCGALIAGVLFLAALWSKTQ